MKKRAIAASPFPYDYKDCRLCPRQCHADRTRLSADYPDRSSPTGSGPYAGFCQSGANVKIARAALHHWEEPCISGCRGSGTVFFSGCALGCCFCQNHVISHQRFGKEVSVQRLAAIFLDLEDQGAHNINLVTATHYLPSVTAALRLVRPHLTIPVVYNCGGYERPEIVKALKPYVDIWLPDLKYYSSPLAARCSGAKDYFSFASRAIAQMVSQSGPPVMDNNGILQSGVIIRHMVLPSQKEDSFKLLEWIKDTLPQGHYRLSLLSQYTPCHLVKDTGSYPDLNRKITTYEYEKVLDHAIELGLTDGYMQEKTSAQEDYTPPFDLEGV